MLPHLKAHQGPVPVVLALACEAVVAVQIAGVGYVEAQRLHHVPGTLFESPGDVREHVGGEELAGVFQGLHVIDAGLQVLFCHVRPGGVLLQQGGDDLLGGVALEQGDDVVGHLVHHVDAAGTAVQHDVIAV